MTCSASEARLASFVAIAKGDVPTRHWFRLGRTETPVGCGSALVSWSGSMFEYLMPSLVMRAPTGSLLEQSNRFVVQRQIEYGAELGLPWGVSESAYNARDLELTYQYSSFGVPGLGLKRGLSHDAVIAPYATALAAMVDPQAAAQNFSRLAAAGGRGRYGWYEALDYTPARLPEGDQGGGRPLLHGAPSGNDPGRDRRTLCTTARCAPAFTPSRLSRQPSSCCRNEFRGTCWSPILELTRWRRRPTCANSFRRCRAGSHLLISRFRALICSPTARYAVMVTAAGSGYSRWHDLAVTRWREDATCDGWGIVRISCAIRAAARCGRQGTNQPESSRIATRRHSLRIELKSSGATD